MRIPAIAPILLTAVLAGCTHNLPTALPDESRAAAARVSVSETVLPFHGKLDAASHTSAYDPVTNTILVHLVGSGTGTHLGRFTLVSDLALDPVALAGPESMSITAANGDMLFATGRGQGTPSQDGQSLESLETLTITGGTGRFAGATGSFTLRQVNLAPDRLSSGSFDGTFDFAR